MKQSPMPPTPPLLSGHYARLEIERRYLLRVLPPDFDSSAGTRILDRYLAGTRLRLRRMDPPGSEPIFKLGHKYPTSAMPPGVVSMTSFYLNQAEYDRLLGLEAREITKTRFGYAQGDARFGIDVFAGPLEGLITAEAEFETVEAFDQAQTPAFALADVTTEPLFTGGSLAALAADEFRTRYNRWLESHDSNA